MCGIGVRPRPCRRSRAFHLTLTVMKDRSSRKEILDSQDIDPSDLKKSLDFMVLINRFFGGAKVVLDFFEKNCAQDRISVLDLGSGSGDIPFALTQWADRQKIDISITALDTQSLCLDYARDRYPSESIVYKNHSAFEIDQLGQFDYIISSMFFHHCDESSIVRMLKMMKKQSRKGFIVNDLLRSNVARLAVSALGVMACNQTVFHDATLSVARGFRESDGEQFRSLSGIDDLSIETKPWFRFVMSYHV